MLQIFPIFANFVTCEKNRIYGNKLMTPKISVKIQFKVNG